MENNYTYDGKVIDNFVYFIWEVFPDTNPFYQQRMTLCKAPIFPFQLHKIFANIRNNRHG